MIFDQTKRPEVEYNTVINELQYVIFDVYYSLDPARQMNGTDADTSPSKPDAAEVFTDGAPAKPEGGGRPRADTPQSSRPVSRLDNIA